MRACPAEEGERVWSLGGFFNKNRIPSVDRMYICSTVIVYHERKGKKGLIGWLHRVLYSQARQYDGGTAVTRGYSCWTRMRTCKRIKSLEHFSYLFHQNL